MNQVQSWAEQRIESLGIILGQEVRGLDLSDDRLESVIFNLSKDESWNSYVSAIKEEEEEIEDISLPKERVFSSRCRSCLSPGISN
jgi:hypothetical protein